MSITILDLLQLPSFQGARVIAGRQGLDRRVTTISVSEYTLGSQFKDVIFDDFDSEIIISAFYAVKGSVEKQCRNVEDYHANRVAGLILFYVGIILPYVDERLITLADRLGFPIIVMPEGRPDLRYSEVIYEVMEAILKSRMTSDDLKNDVIQQVSRFPEHKQSVGTVLRILSNKTHSTIILADSAGKPINASAWPRNLAVESYLRNGVVHDQQESAQIHGETYPIYGYNVKSSRRPSYKAMIYKRGVELEPHVVRQVGETIQMAINLWERGHGDNLLSELVGGILKDEFYKVRQIATTFNIRVQDIRYMWMVSPVHGETAERLLQAATRLTGEELSHRCGTVIFDIHDGVLVVLMTGWRSGGSLISVTQSFCENLKKNKVEATVTVCQNLEDLAQIRKAFLTNKRTLDTARIIYPLKRFFTFSEIKFADKCKKIIESGESGVHQHTEILRLIPREERVSYQEMLKTLSTYYLDAKGSFTAAGKLLYLHINTIKYRIRKFQERAPDGLKTIPEIDELYTALAVNRIIERSQTQ